MKIEINVDEKTEDTHIVISCKKLTPELQRLLAMLHILDKQLTVRKGEEIFFLDDSGGESHPYTGYIGRRFRFCVS